MLRGFYISLFSILLNSYLCLGQLKGHFKNITTEHGLSSERIGASVQDNDGFIWFATNDGLCKYDGYRIDVFKNIENDSTSISGNIITTLLIDSKGFLWAGTYESGLCRINTKTGKVVEILSQNSTKNKIKDNRITCLWEDTRNQKIWIGVNQKIADCYDLKTNKILDLKFKVNPNLYVSTRSKTAFAFEAFKDDKNKVWIGTSDGLLLYNSTIQTFDWFKYKNTEIPEFDLENRIRHIVCEPNNSLWIATRGGGIVFFDYKNNLWESYKYKSVDEKTTAKNLVLYLVQNKTYSNKLWVSTLDNSLGIFDKKTKQFEFYKPDLTNNYSIISNEISNCFYDKSGSLWLSSNNGVGIYTPKFQKFLFNSIPKISSSSESNFFGAYSFAESADNKHLYFGLNNAKGLIILDKTTNKFVVILPKNKEKDETYSFMRMAKDSADNLWLVSLANLFKYDIQKKTLNEVVLPKPFNLDEHKTQSLCFDKKGLLYIGTRRAGMIRVNLKTNEIKHFRHQENKNSIVADGYVQEILCDKNGILWIATERGLSRFDPNTEQFTNFYEGTNGVPKGIKVIFRLIEDQTGLIWLTTEANGTYAIDPKSLKFVKNIAQNDGLLSNSINGLACDKQNGIWLTSPKGLSYYNQNTKEIYNFDRRNGLDQNYLQYDIHRLNNNQIILGYKDGYTIFNPAELWRTRNNYSPKLTNFYIFDKKQQLIDNSNILLNYDQNFFSFEFSSLDFTIPDKVKYSYQLEGVDEHWVELQGNPRVSYTNIEAGKYTFKIRAVEQNSQWNETFTTISVIIKPPFWQTWWFYLVIFLLASSTIYFFYKKRIENLQEKVRVNEQITLLKMNVLRNQMNPHLIFNSLNSVRYFVLSDQKEKAKDYLSKFAKLLRTILNYSRENVVSLSNEIEAIKLYIEVELGRFESNFKYIVKIDNAVEIDYISIPPLLLQPYIENAILHGLLNSEKTDKMLKISVNQKSEDLVEILIEDNGIGRTKSKEINLKKENKSLGIDITNQRIEFFNQNFKSKISVKTIDLPNDGGTKVCVFIKS